jgi:uncharacterized protein (TIGR02646 family)
MIRIRISGQPPRAWLKKAARITEQLERAATSEERQKIIAGNEKHWGKLKEWLLEQTHGKCWFSEVKDKYSYYHIEHFRPKGKAKELDGTEREGYWWLAFNWLNYRIIGGVGNIGKGSFFPLKAGTAAANALHRDISGEWHCFLDPLNEHDVSLISFNEEGLMEPVEGISAWEKQRVEITIRLLNLNRHEPLVEARQATWTECTRYINLFLHSQEELGKSQDAKSKYELAIERLKELVSDQTELSAVAVTCIYKRNIPRLNRVLFRPA